MVTAGGGRPSGAVACRRGATLALATTVAGAATAGCYTTQPLLGPPNPGAEVAATLNDRGRAALADSLGRDVDVVEGRVTARTDTSLVLALTRVRSFGGTVTPWAGEQVSFRTTSLRALQERRLARGRTIGLVAGAGAVVVALVLTRALTGGGSGGVGGEPGSGPPAGQ